MYLLLKKAVVAIIHQRISMNFMNVNNLLHRQSLLIKELWEHSYKTWYFFTGCSDIIFETKEKPMNTIKHWKNFMIHRTKPYHQKNDNFISRISLTFLLNMKPLKNLLFNICKTHIAIIIRKCEYLCFEESEPQFGSLSSKYLHIVHV